ncbi:MAG: M56 family metallopeptidase [Gammaproteobacteria bacterium]
MTDTLLAALLDVSVRSAVLIGIGWLASVLMHRRSAAERHTVWLMTLAGVALLPLIIAAGPRFELALPAPLVEYAVLQPAASPAVSAAAAHSDALGVSIPGSRAAAVGVAAAGDAAVDAAAQPVPITLAQAALIFYVFTACLLGLRYAGMRIRVRRHLGALEPLDDARLRQRSDAIRARFGLRGDVVLLRSDRDHSPWAWGFVRPAVVVPAEFARWSASQQDRAFMHELAHIARNDHLAGALAQLCCVFQWFNPLVWFAARRLRLEAEQAADDRVISTGASAHRYAEQLVQIASRVFNNESRSVWISAMAHRSSLSLRVRSILDPNKRRTEMSRLRMSVFALAAGAVLVPLAALQSQEPVADISDAQFQLMVQYGPNGSTELETIVDAYVANDSPESAADAIARFVLSEYGTLDVQGCEFCIEVFSSEATPRQHEHFSLMVAAFDRIEQRAQTEGSGDLLLQAALNNIVSSGNARAMKRATYYVVRAAQIGIDAQLSLSVVGFLYEQGNIAAARDLATHLYENESSPHYQSEAARQWQEFLNSEMGRRESVARLIFSSLGVDDATADGDYLPVVKTPPAYPADAEQMGLEGQVVVEFTVDTTGKPANVSIVSSSNSLFNESAVAAARQFRYAPRVVAGTPVEVPGVRNRIAYRLSR